VHCCLRAAARNRWTRDSGRDELGTDRNQRILPQLPSSQFSQPSTTAQEIERFFFALSTSRFGRDVWSCVPPCFKWTGITQCGTGAALIWVLSLAKMLFGANAFEISDIQEDETEASLVRRSECNNDGKCSSDFTSATVGLGL
jgi:hypothetical protein